MGPTTNSQLPRRDRGLKILDSNGAIIPSLERAVNGAIIVNDQNSLNKYKNEQKQALEIIDLREQLAETQRLVQLLLSKTK